MITLKAALIAASAIGAVAVGGGATYAMTGSSQEAGLQNQSAKAPAAQRQVQDAVPATPPTCLPAKPGTKVPDAETAKKLVEQRKKELEQKLPPDARTSAKVPNSEAAKKQLEEKLRQDPTGGKLPQGQLPKTDVPGVKAPTGTGQVPADVPTCAPNPKDLGKGVPAQKPDARVGQPGLPSVPKLDCDALKPAVQVGSPVEKTVMLTKGLKYTSAVPGSADLRKQNICAVTQKWTGRSGQWISVETLKTPAGMTQNQLQQALNLPQGGTPISVFGSAGWVGPGGNGVLVFDPSGYSMFVNGSPVFAGGLQDVTTALRQAR